MITVNGCKGQFSDTSDSLRIGNAVVFKSVENSFERLTCYEVKIIPEC